MRACSLFFLVCTLALPSFLSLSLSLSLPPSSLLSFLLALALSLARSLALSLSLSPSLARALSRSLSLTRLSDSRSHSALCFLALSALCSQRKRPSTSRRQGGEARGLLRHAHRGTVYGCTVYGCTVYGAELLYTDVELATETRKNLPTLGRTHFVAHQLHLYLFSERGARAGMLTRTPRASAARAPPSPPWRGGAPPPSPR